MAEKLDVPYRRRSSIPGISESGDRMVGMIVALTAQVAAMRERIDTLEALLEANGTLPPQAVELFVADQAASIRRDGLRADLISKVLQPVRDAVAREAQHRRGSSQGGGNV